MAKRKQNKNETEHFKVPDYNPLRVVEVVCKHFPSEISYASTDDYEFESLIDLAENASLVDKSFRIRSGKLFESNSISIFLQEGWFSISCERHEDNIRVKSTYEIICSDFRKMIDSGEIYSDGPIDKSVLVEGERENPPSHVPTVFIGLFVTVIGGLILWWITRNFDQSS